MDELMWVWDHKPDPNSFAPPHLGRRWLIKNSEGRYYYPDGWGRTHWSDIPCPFSSDQHRHELEELFSDLLKQGYVLLEAESPYELSVAHALSHTMG